MLKILLFVVAVIIIYNLLPVAENDNKSASECTISTYYECETPMEMLARRARRRYDVTHFGAKHKPHHGKHRIHAPKEHKTAKGAQILLNPIVGSIVALVSVSAAVWLYVWII